ncbi:uncharacterized protein N7503_005975 [Penicillium pulvis]|uniref:uncharacterized protein n=1 Tax=Penicillium pulvis TaxID=1562058 RepID=UPI0025492B12|nr:uncharacterized protein N7503_005975 [Penicillium pulvis]KAJ5803525.1 hypothetical protein N7503_005975 [Penicillium pulvis]
MFETLKSWFQGADAPLNENKWDANTVTMQQPNSPAAPSMNQTVTEQPGGVESMGVHMRGGDGGDLCCGICAGLCCFECCECCCGDCCGPDGPPGPPGGPGFGPGP